MEKITTYVNNVFSSLPDTPKVQHLKKNILDSMTEKYNQLLQEGKGESEAFGIVIADFGDIEEIRQELDGAPEAESTIFESPSFESKSVNPEDVITDYGITEERISAYDHLQNTFSKVLPFSIVLFIIAAAIMVTAGARDEELSSPAFVSFFILVAIGVSLLIFFGSRLSSFDDLKTYHKALVQSVMSRKDFPIDAARIQKYRLEKQRLSFIVPVAVGLFILSFIPVYLVRNDPMNEPLSLWIFFILVSIGVAMLVYQGYRTSMYPDVKAYEAFLYYKNTGELPEDFVEDHELNPYSGPIYIIATVIFLILGFWKNLWHPGWVIYVLAAALVSLTNIRYFRKK